MLARTSLTLLSQAMVAPRVPRPAVVAGAAAAAAAVPRRRLRRAALSSAADDADNLYIHEFSCSACDGIELAVRSYGHRGRPVLAMHGWLDNVNTFDAMAPVLARAGYLLVAMDFPGHGLSSRRSIDSTLHIMDLPFYANEVRLKRKPSQWPKPKPKPKPEPEPRILTDFCR